MNNSISKPIAEDTVEESKEWISQRQARHEFGLTHYRIKKAVGVFIRTSDSKMSRKGRNHQPYVWRPDVARFKQYLDQYNGNPV